MAGRYDAAMRASQWRFLLPLVVLNTACGGDGDKPALEWLSPLPGAEVAGAVRLKVDGDGTATLYVDAVSPAGEIAVVDPREEVPWFSPEVANGPHTLIARSGAMEVRLDVTVANTAYPDTVPPGAVKVTPATDQHPPLLEPAFQNMFEDPAPLGAPINLAGAEDSPYITADGQNLYFWYTPDPQVPVQDQLFDGATGVYWSRWNGSQWSTPERVFLNYHDELALDGCETIYGNEMWFCSARAGNLREIDIWTAGFDGVNWSNWQNAGTRLNLEVGLGEMHVSNGGNTITFHSDLPPGGAGGLDIWTTTYDGVDWSDPVNLTPVNTTINEGWPWVSEDDSEMFFTTGAAAPEIWRSVKVSGAWQAPEKVLGPFAGEPTLDGSGDLYFVHHFWDDATNSMLEADIYVARRK
jgi:hypothetical protein